MRYTVTSDESVVSRISRSNRRTLLERVSTDTALERLAVSRSVRARRLAGGGCLNLTEWPRVPSRNIQQYLSLSGVASAVDGERHRPGTRFVASASATVRRTPDERPGQGITYVPA